MAFDSTYSLYVTGIKCHSESSRDQLSSSDEIYIFINSVNPAGHTGHFASRVYNNVDSGQFWNVTSDGTYYLDGKQIDNHSCSVWRKQPVAAYNNQQMMTVSLDMWEEDNGSIRGKMDEYFDSQYKKLSKLETTLNTRESGSWVQSAHYWGNFSNRPPAGEQLLWKEISRWFTSDLLGLDDDHIGSSMFTITDIDDIRKRIYIRYQNGSEGWYNINQEIALYVNGGDEGKYTVYLKFEINQRGDNLNDIEKREKKIVDNDEQMKQRLQDKINQIPMLLETLTAEDREYVLGFSDKKLIIETMQSSVSEEFVDKVIFAIKHRRKLAEVLTSDIA